MTDLIAHIGLQPHPEGGFYREYLRAPEQVIHPLHGQPRAAVTGIWFYLPADTFSALHVVASTEIWHHLQGGAVELHLIHPDGRYELVLLGPDDDAHTSQYAVPPGVWQASVPRGPTGALCGCTVAPGFDFADFQMPPRDALLKLFPQHADLVTRLTRAGAGGS